MGTVIGFGGIIGTRDAPRHLAPDDGTPWFTVRDRADMEAWGRGGRRAVLVASELGVFAMLHEGGRAWASWGIVRQARGVLVWNCVTLADVDRFATMADALAAIDGDVGPALIENVVSFMAHAEIGLSRRLANSL